MKASTFTLSGFKGSGRGRGRGRRGRDNGNNGRNSKGDGSTKADDVIMNIMTNPKLSVISVINLAIIAQNVALSYQMKLIKENSQTISKRKKVKLF